MKLQIIPKCKKCGGDGRLKSSSPTKRNQKKLAI